MSAINIRAWLTSIGTISHALPLVILYVTEGCNLQCGMCSYRSPLPNELTVEEIKELAATLSGYGLRHIVYSGGEPLIRQDFAKICEIFQHYGVKQTLLTNGLLLHKRLNELRKYFDEIIVSLDGAVAETHNSIRGVNSFDLIIKGIQEAVRNHTAKEISIRTVVQKKNFKEIPHLVGLAKSLGVNRISFLAADVLSDSFGRTKQKSTLPNETISLSAEELKEFMVIIEQMFVNNKPEFESRFISESPEKMMHILQYFQALLGQHPFPENTCNAPMVSAVITANGNLQPCFFLPSFGNIRNESFLSLINNEVITSTRKKVKEYTLKQCQECVCTLNVSSRAALFNKF
jgi:MoaA/NifB/PqqE/SkfB family radical SAM enzyme